MIATLESNTREKKESSTSILTSQRQLIKNLPDGFLPGQRVEYEQTILPGRSLYSKKHCEITSISFGLIDRRS